MRFEEIDQTIGSLFGISQDRARILYEWIIEHNIQNILELGFAHGKSSLYMAAALDEIGSGSITTIDFQDARKRKPNISTLMTQAGLDRYIKPVYAERSYTWELMKLIESNTYRNSCNPIFDFCFIDGGHTWYPTGYAFFLVEKLIKPKGWVLFDDLSWTIEEGMPEEFKRNIPEEERKTAQVEKVFSLLVRQHPNFKNIKDDGKWGWAQKKD